MSAESSIPTPPLPGKDPPLQPSSTPRPMPALPPASTSPFNVPPTIQPSTSSPLSASKSMAPPPRPQISTTSTSTLPLQTSEVPLTASAPRLNFSPFFTLINDSTTQSTHHPSRIYYIFSDDDESEILTAACVRSLQQDIEDESPAASGESGGSEQGKRESETSSSSSATFKKGGERIREKGKSKTPMKREERAIIVDINESGDGIVGTSSLSSYWQVSNADILNAPTFNNDNIGDTGVDEEGRGLMLKIEGVASASSTVEGELGDSGEKMKGKAVGESSVMGEEEMQALMERFDRKMGLLRKIVATGESWDEARRDKVVGGGDGMATRMAERNFEWWRNF